MTLSDDERNVLQSIVTSAVMNKVFASLEADDFSAFMGIPPEERHGDKGRELVRRIDALRALQSRLNSLASTSTAAPRAVV